jgi:CubicO group peptidase (beta-lactamase class C family)
VPRGGFEQVIEVDPMQRDDRDIRPRRAVLRALAAGAIAHRPVFAQPAAAGTAQGAGPEFDRAGPDAARYGIDEGYPVPSVREAVREGNPWQPRYRVGAFSRFDALYPTRPVVAAPTAWTFERATAPIGAGSALKQLLDDYLARNPVTGLLLAKGDAILFERYQYARSDRDRMLSQSLVKSIVGVLVGIAIGDGAIASVDDLPERYVPGFAGTEYGRTPIRDLLHMASGVDFGEQRDQGRDLDRLWRDMVLGSGLVKKGTIASIVQFDRRAAPPGTTFRYASIEPDVLTVVLRHAVGTSASAYLQEKLWQPIGAEADARWLLDAEGFEVGHFGFNAVLRDYARLARLLAHDGAWNGRQVVPKQWIVDATTVRAKDGFLAPGHATLRLGYGYLLWLLPGGRRQFALLGQNGQRICIDPGSKLVMVHTALEDNDEVWRLWAALSDRLA